jgi:hypothetical protein
MSSLLGILGTSDVDTRLLALAAQPNYDEVNRLAARYEAERDETFRVFVQETTIAATETYKLPGDGYMQRLDNHGRPFEERPAGGWDTGYPWETFGTAVGWDYETYAHMTAGAINNLMQSAMLRNANTHRFEILKAIFNNTNRTFVDRFAGTITVRRLANGDGSTYPPVLGTTTEADDTHYLESGYAASAISDTNNPLKTIRNELDEHFGTGQAVVFINPAQTDKISDLASFVDKVPQFTVAGQDTAVLTSGLPTVPGKIIGAANDVLVSEWRWIPANYMVGIDLTQPGPLKMRQPVPEQLRGFRLEAEEESNPFYKRTWVDRFGYGAGNRLNGVVMELGTGGTYTVPSGY